MLVLQFLSAATFAADLYAGIPTVLVDPVCITDPADAFQAEGPPPEDRYALVVRHMGADALQIATDYDFSALDGRPLTNLRVPAPRSVWQRAKTSEDPNFTSAFQLHCADAGFFINAWRFAPEELIDEGPHATYGYSFSKPPAAFDADERTDLVIQAELEVPWHYRPAGDAVVQTYFQIRFVDTTSGRFLQMTLTLFNTDGVTFEPYASYARNDSLFVAAPLDSSAVVTRSPYSAEPSGVRWTGLRFFRGQISPANFRAALDLANRYCADKNFIPDCTVASGEITPLHTDPGAYRITEFSVITEVFNADTGSNGVSVGLHLRGLGLYNFR